MQVEGIHHFYFGSAFAQAWYEEFHNPDIVPRETDEAIRSVDPAWIEAFFQRVARRFYQDAG